MKNLMLTIVAIVALAGLPVVSYGAAPNQVITGGGMGACSYVQSKANNRQPGSLSGCTQDSKGKNEDFSSLARDIVNTILYAAGIVCFIFILVGGFRYLTATGDPSRIQGAKDTLLYAIIGLIITFLAIPIAGFVIHVATGGS